MPARSSAAFAGLWSKISVYFKNQEMKSATSKFQYLPVTTPPAIQPVFTHQLQQELDQLLTSLRKQVRNVVAVAGWMERNKQLMTTNRTLAGKLPALQLSQPEELTFPLKASAEAFALFTQTLLRTSSYLQENARVDARQQVLKVQVNFRALDAWEFEMSVIFEQITPAVYVNTLLYDRPLLRTPQRIAS
jgi:hypothetical protein